MKKRINKSSTPSVLDKRMKHMIGNINKWHVIGFSVLALILPVVVYLVGNQQVYQGRAALSLSQTFTITDLASQPVSCTGTTCTTSSDYVTIKFNESQTQDLLAALPQAVLDPNKPLPTSGQATPTPPPSVVSTPTPPTIPTSTSTPTPTRTPTPTPTRTPTPTPKPTATPTPSPTPTPTPVPPCTYDSEYSKFVGCDTSKCAQEIWQCPTTGVTRTFATVAGGWCATSTGNTACAAPTPLPTSGQATPTPPPPSTVVCNYPYDYIIPAGCGACWLRNWACVYDANNLTPFFDYTCGDMQINPACGGGPTITTTPTLLPTSGQALPTSGQATPTPKPLATSTPTPTRIPTSTPLPTSGQATPTIKPTATPTPKLTTIATPTPLPTSGQATPTTQSTAVCNYPYDYTIPGACGACWLRNWACKYDANNLTPFFDYTCGSPQTNPSCP